MANTLIDVFFFICFLNKDLIFVKKGGFQVIDRISARSVWKKFAHICMIWTYINDIYVRIFAKRNEKYPKSTLVDEHFETKPMKVSNYLL